MTTFTIDADNNVTAFASREEAEAAGIADYFGSQDEFTKLAASWPSNRLITLWNSLPGVTPVKKFTDRRTAVARIWKAAQALTPPSAPPARQDAPVRTRAPKKAGQARKRATARPGAKRAGRGRSGSKTAQVLALLERSNGASLKELMDATGWQAHSVRGFLSGQVGKKMGRKVDSFAQDGERHYRLKPSK